MKRTIILAIVLGLVGGCVSSRDRIGEAIDADWLERRDTLRLLDDWRMDGRLALKTGTDGYNGTLSWEQLEEDLDFRFRGPFGFGGFRIHGDLERLRVKTTSGTEFYLKDPETEMIDRFGWSVPVYSMRFWIVGVSDPATVAEEIVDEEGLLEALVQNGWQVQYDGYSVESGIVLPRKIVMEKGDIRIRVLAERWRIEPPDRDDAYL